MVFKAGLHLGFYCNVQHVALAPPGMRKQLFCPPLEQNPKCSPVTGTNIGGFLYDKLAFGKGSVQRDFGEA